jgi:predicted nucleic acid-binding protein
VIVLDTTVLIDVLRGHRPALDYLLALEEPPACSEITRVEVLRGIRHREREATEELMRAIRWIGVDEQIARRAGALGRTWRRSHALATADLVIGATAQELGADLATSNTRHFPMFAGLEPPYPLA